jgi:hypothetical protein
MKSQKFFIAIILFLLTIPIKIYAQNTSKNLTWMIWEQRDINTQLCQTKGLCAPIRKFTTRLIEEPTEQKAREMLRAIEQLAILRGQPAEHPETPKMCRQTEASKILGFNPEAWDLSDKMAALKDLPGVYFSVTSIKGPSEYTGDFGLNLQNAMESRFHAAELPVLSEERMETTAGKPQLNIYFSNAKPDTRCTYSVFASLSQTMLLTRNHTTKLKVGTWGHSGGPSSDFPNSGEFDAIMRVVDKFLDDYKRANASKS